MGNVCDNCPNDYNPGQEDADGDGKGDACEDDIDNDGILNANDNCPDIPNPNQVDSDGDGLGDVCDNCPNDYNPGQEDENGNFIGDPCDVGADTDNDGVVDGADNCPSISNSDQLDTDHDGKFAYDLYNKPFQPLHCFNTHINNEIGMIPCFRDWRCL